MAIQIVRCPNCGAHAQRHLLPLLAQVRTECDACDYLLAMCTRSGRVIESYAPGRPSQYLMSGPRVSLESALEAIRIGA